MRLKDAQRGSWSSSIVGLSVKRLNVWFVGMIVGLKFRTVGKVALSLSQIIWENKIIEMASVFISRALSHLFKKNSVSVIDRQDLLSTKPN